MLLTQEVLDKAVYRGIALLATLNVLVTAFLTRRGSEIYPFPLLTVSLTVFAVCALWCVLDCWAQIRSRAGAKALVVAGFATTGAHLLMVTAPQGYAAHPPLYPLMAAGMCAAPFAFGFRAGASLIALFAVMSYWIRLPDVGSAQAVQESLLMAMTGFVSAALLHFLAKAAAEVEAASQNVWELQESTARAASRIAERERWNALVHDKVLGALRLAGRSRSLASDDAARELAREALSEFDGDTAAARIHAIEQTLRDHARKLALRLKINIEGSLSDRSVTEAFAGAATEALTNVARHSEQSTATVTGRLGTDSATMHIVDDGCGFDPATTSARRLGISSSIEKRMRAVGGSAQVMSTLGHGTVVELSWADTHVDGPDAHPTWKLRTFAAPLAAVATVTLALHLSMGWRYLSQSRQPWITVAGMVATVLVTLTLGVMPRMSRTAQWAAIAATALPVALVANLKTYDVVDYRYWFIGALDTAVILIAVKLSSSAGVIAALAMMSGVIAVQASAGSVAWSTVATSFPQVLVCAVAAGLCRRALDYSAEFIAQEADASGLLRLEAAEKEEREAELARRAEGLGRTVVPKLKLIADETPLNDDERRQCLAMEAAARDQLVAHEILNAELVEALREARERGVMVEIAAQRVTSPDAVRAFQNVCLALLPAASTGARVRALWRSTPDGRFATVSVVPCGVLSAADQAALEAAGRDAAPLAVDATSDGFSTLVVIGCAPTPN